MFFISIFLVHDITSSTNVFHKIKFDWELQYFIHILN